MIYVGATASIGIGTGNAPYSVNTPAGVADGDLLVAVLHSRGLAGISATEFTGTWTDHHSSLGSGGLMRVWSTFRAGHTSVQANVTGAGANDSTILKMIAFRGVRTVNPIPRIGVVSPNASAQNIGPIAGIALDAIPDETVVVVGAKFATTAGVAILTGDGFTWVEALEQNNFNGDDNSMVIDYAITPAGGAVTPKTFTVSGGSAAIGNGIMFEIASNLPPISAGGGVARSLVQELVG